MAEVVALSQPSLRRRATQILLSDGARGLLPGPRETRYQRAFQIAYVAFDGLPLGYAFDAAGELLDEIDLKSGHAPANRPAFDRSVPELLGEDLCRDWAHGMDADAGGTNGASRMAYVRDASFVGHVLDVAWHDLDNTRPALLGWLRRLADDDRLEVRRRAAVIAGWLAHHDFEQVYGKLIDGWASAPRPHRRHVAGWTLTVAATGVRTRPVIAARLRDWARPPASPSRSSRRSSSR
jgi:hypothetical protein